MTAGSSNPWPGSIGPTLSAGTVLGRYTLGRCIGLGGMGAVYEATHNDLKKRVAIKVLDPRLAHDPEISARFLREGESAARIQHPHVVDIYDVGTQDDVSYLVMELLVGEDLGLLLERIGPLDAQSSTAYILPVCAALVAAHRSQVIHRDLKPGNIFLAKDVYGAIVPKVLDFGISKNTQSPIQGLTMAGVLMGTPHYMSPEQAQGNRHVDHRTDIYSLGVVLYQCLTGVCPFVGESTYRLLNRIVEAQFASPRSVVPDLDPILEQVVLRAMARDPAARFATMAEFGAALLPFSDQRLQLLWAPMFERAGAEPTPPVAFEAAYAEPVAADPPGITTIEHGGAARRNGPSTAAYWATAIIATATVAGLTAFGFSVMSPVPAAPVVAIPAPPPPEEPVAAPPPIALPLAPTYRISVTVEPRWAMIVIDGKAVAQGHYETTMQRDGRTHTLAVGARQYITYEGTFTDAPPPATIKLEKQATKAKPVSIRNAPFFASSTSSTAKAKKAAGSSSARANKNAAPAPRGPAVKAKPSASKPDSSASDATDPGLSGAEATEPPSTGRPPPTPRRGPAAEGPSVGIEPGPAADEVPEREGGAAIEETVPRAQSEGEPGRDRMIQDDPATSRAPTSEPQTTVDRSRRARRARTAKTSTTTGARDPIRIRVD